MSIRTAAVVGGGVIGAGWAARLIENGVDVALYDPDPEAPRKTAEVVANADHALAQLHPNRLEARGALTYAGSIAEAVAGAQWIVESVPERLDLKQKVYAEIEAAAAPDAVIASSTSGILPTDLQANMTRPERLIVAHPFNPVYLLPVVEIVGGAQTGSDAIDRAMTVYAELGMKPVRVRKEIPAFVADRLLEAIWRESLWLIHDGICTTAELDDIVRYGFGLRYAQMGVFDTYRVAGGEAGMRHFMAQFGPCLTWPWTKLMDTPEYTDELVDLIAGQSDEQSGHMSIRAMERARDDNLVAILHALKAQDWGAGQTVAAHEKRLADRQGAGSSAVESANGLMITLRRTVPAEWADYNGHMTEWRYAQCFSDATDSFMSQVGCDAEYLATGGSFFTAENHVRFLSEIKIGEPVTVDTRLIAATGKKMHVFHTLRRADGSEAATGESMLIHVDMATRKAAPPAPHIAARLAEVHAVHSALPAPDGLGRAVGQKR